MHLQKKRGKTASFFINTILPNSKKNDGPHSLERVHKSPKLPKTIEKLESSADHDLGNIQNATPSIHMINTPLLYRKDDSRGIGSNYVLTIGFSQRSPFIRKGLGNNQKAIDNIISMINYRHRNSSKPGNIFYKTKNAKYVQINATAGERRFQTQNRNNVAVENSAYIDKTERKREKRYIILSQTQGKGFRNEETQQHRDIENRSIITTEKHLTEFCQKQQKKLKQIKKPHISLNSNENLQKWTRNTTLLVSDSMLFGIEERRISIRDRDDKAKNFPGATIDVMYDYIKPWFKKRPDNIILHVSTNNTANESSGAVLGKLLDLKKFIENTLLESNVIISNVVTRTDNGKASLIVIKTTEHLYGLQMGIIDNVNITSNELNEGGLNLNPRGLGKQACYQHY